MQVHQDWLVPTVGGLPWLERPPLSHWVLVGVGTVFGGLDQDWIARIGPILVSPWIVCMVAWMGSVWFGRALGMLSGLILATMWEFYQYASNPEADIFLCAVVTGAMALFVRLEFAGTEDKERTSSLGRRSWTMLAFFIVLGMTNLVKGLIFGTLMAIVPLGIYLLVSWDWQTIRRYIWLWGWLAFALVWLSWPVAVYLRHPDVIELWRSDYLGRLNGGYVGQPPWYYLTALPWVMLPWTLPALLGLWGTRAAAWREKHGPARFLWVWALVPVLFFSIPDGKHHHYLLQCLAPWAIFAALGAVKLWQGILAGPAWLRKPLAGALLVGIPADLVILSVRERIPGPIWVVPVLMVWVPAFLFGFGWSVSRPNGRAALVSFFLFWLVVFSNAYSYQAHYLNAYRSENAFLGAVRERVPEGKPLYIVFDYLHPLETFRLLFYTGENSVMLHNVTFLKDDRIQEAEVLVLARLRDQKELAKMGRPEVLLVSNSSRGSAAPEDQRALFRLSFAQTLERVPGDVPISVMQAVHRARGPFLE
jgi:4-amino-4-deoxy-L-arabinose transferase-like glycosyltransferase